MRTLIIGSGAREHALGWKLKKDSPGAELGFVPGNGGTSHLGINFPFDPQAGDSYTNAASQFKAEFVVIAPEAPLAEGLADDLESLGFPVFGPKKLAARLEASKIFSKIFMERHKIPTAKYKAFDSLIQAKAYLQESSFPVVIKADGLAQGKGCVVCDDKNQAEQILENFMGQAMLGSAGKRVVIEEFLQGEELTIMAFFDGTQFVFLPPVRDYKRLQDGNQGPNTGGMGSFSPVTVTPTFWNVFNKEIAEPFRRALETEGILYRGLIYFGLMLTPHGLRVLEFNVRFGDPETQAALPLVDVPLLELMQATREGMLLKFHHSILLSQLENYPRHSICVVLASEGYPQAPVTGHPITLPDSLNDPVCLFHAGTKKTEHSLVTSGGRVLSVVGFSSNPQEARELAYATIDKIRFEGMQYRKDIALRS